MPGVFWTPPPEIWSVGSTGAELSSRLAEQPARASTNTRAIAKANLLCFIVMPPAFFHFPRPSLCAGADKLKAEKFC
jgi:hypothetical protein